MFMDRGGGQPSHNMMAPTTPTVKYHQPYHQGYGAPYSRGNFFEPQHQFMGLDHENEFGMNPGHEESHEDGGHLADILQNNHLDEASP